MIFQTREYKKKDRMMERNILPVYNLAKVIMIPVTVFFPLEN